MQTKAMLGGIAVLVALGAMPLRAQTSVDAGVTVHSGGTTVGGHVSTGSPPPVVVVREPVREVIVVERMRRPHGDSQRWWRKRGYREVRVYSDGESYYARRSERRPGLYAIIIFERQGRYYRWDDDNGGDRRWGKNRGDDDGEHGHRHEHHGEERGDN